MIICLPPSAFIACFTSVELKKGKVKNTFPNPQNVAKLSRSLIRFSTHTKVGKLSELEVR